MVDYLSYGVLFTFRTGLVYNLYNPYVRVVIKDLSCFFAGLIQSSTRSPFSATNTRGRNKVDQECVVLQISRSFLTS